MRSKLTALFAGAALVLALGAADVLAQAKKGGVSIGGNAVQNTAVLGNTTTVGIGKDVKAKTAIGQVTDSNIKGNLVQNTAVLGNTTTVGIGKDVKAGTGIGTVSGADVKGNLVQNTAVLGNTTTVGIGKGVEACTTIGGIGENPACKD
jgi:hypothetical protein